MSGKPFHVSTILFAGTYFLISNLLLLQMYIKYIGIQWNLTVCMFNGLSNNVVSNAFIYFFIYLNSIAGSKSMEYNDKKPSNIYITHTKNTVTPTVKKRR